MTEIALAHAVLNKVEAAYRRGDVLEKRRLMMQDWGAYYEAGLEEQSGNVVPIGA